MRLLPVLLICLSFLGAPAAVAAQPAEPILGEAGAVLQVNDLGWLDRQVASFAAISGRDPAPLRSRLAEVLFRSRSLAGIDPGRPAVLAWRPGPAPLVAVIPLTDRRAFAADFGAVSALDAPLVRVGEGQGTVIYKQNGPDGLVEYRMLVQDDTAYLARTAEECRLLAQRPLRIVAGQAPVSYRASGDHLRRFGSVDGGSDLARALVDRGAFLRWLGRGLDDAIAQIAACTVEVAPANDGAVRIVARLSPRSDSVLAQWTSVQKNTASRLLPLVRGPRTVFVLHGQVDWQGQLDRFGQRLTDAARAMAGERWAPRTEEAWRSWWEIADRGSAFALAYDAEGEAGRPSFSSRYVLDQHRAQELVALDQLLAAVFADEGIGIGGFPGAEAAEPERAAFAGWSGYLETHPGGLQRVKLANDRRVVEVAGADAAPVAAALLAALAAAPPAPEGLPAVLAASLDATALARALMPPIEGVPPPTLPQVDLGVALKSSSQGVLTAESEIPLQQLAILLREANSVIQAGEPVDEVRQPQPQPRKR